MKVKLILPALVEARQPGWRSIGNASGTVESGYWKAYRDFYRWSSIFRSASTKGDLWAGLRHMAYTGGWKKMDTLWELVIRAKRVAALGPVLETLLEGRSSPALSSRERGVDRERLDQPA